MKLLSEEPQPRPGPRRRLRVVLAALALLAAAAGTVWLWQRGSRSTPRAARGTSDRLRRPAAPTVPARGATSGRIETAPSKLEGGTPGRPSQSEAPLLRVESDVPGASVFVDRRPIGRTPLQVRELTPGTHRLNVTADGYEMFSDTIEVGAGARTVVVRFKEVRLDEALAVAHKHGVGSCRGRLLATTDGLRYQTGDAKDAFEAPFSALEPLQVDYLARNLRVKVKGGKTYNFTADSADALLSFQRAVEAARKRL